MMRMCSTLMIALLLSGTGRAQLADRRPDGLHPNAKGYRVRVPLVAAAIQKALP
jgi:lysophospholipase L1-like esterase